MALDPLGHLGGPEGGLDGPRSGADEPRAVDCVSGETQKAGAEEQKQRSDWCRDRANHYWGGALFPPSGVAWGSHSQWGEQLIGASHPSPLPPPEYFRSLATADFT